MIKEIKSTTTTRAFCLVKGVNSPQEHVRFNTNQMCACSGNTPETRGTAYVVYEDIFDAKNACDHLSGFNVCNRYLVVLYYNANRVGLGLPVMRRVLVSVLGSSAAVQR